MAGIQHGHLVSSVKKRTRTTCRALLNPRLGVTGSQQVDLRSLWTMKVLLKKWHAVKKAAGPAGIPVHEQNPPLQVEGSNILNIFSEPETVAPKPIDDGDSPMQLERPIVPAIGSEAADLAPKSVRKGDAPSGSGLVSMLTDVADMASRIRFRSVQLLQAYGATTALCDLSEVAETLEVTRIELKTRATDTNNFDNQFGPERTPIL
jgi:hypothetical protein